jgi:hypothetical protein
MIKIIFSALIGISIFVPSVYADGSISNTSGVKKECNKGPESKEISAEKLSKIAGNYDVVTSTTTTQKKSDGAACSSDDECEGKCEGGSCCTRHDEPCNEYSHCCGHQSCNNGTCP